MTIQNQQGLPLPIDHQMPPSMCGPAHYFAALKLIEQLYKDGHISARILRNILTQYADIVDLSKFASLSEKEDVA